MPPDWRNVLFFPRGAAARPENRHNQIFLSASKTQAYVFREYIIAFARLVDVDLTGTRCPGNNGAKLIFLGTNSNTAQSHNGDLYVDEIFWIPNFQVLRKVASGMPHRATCARPISPPVHAGARRLPVLVG
ncbi:terminase large subunit domain-containing protein [Escherichia coli]|uniref:terminase large subunit domain-containing protein n=1 Tax=Escherichia coli TaxID=562 RepID=UPI003320D795